MITRPIAKEVSNGFWEGSNLFPLGLGQCEYITKKNLVNHAYKCIRIVNPDRNHISSETDKE